MPKFNVGDIAIFQNTEVVIQEILPLVSWKDEPPQISYVVRHNFIGNGCTDKAERFVVEEAQLHMLNKIESETVLWTSSVPSGVGGYAESIESDLIFEKHFTEKHPIVIYVIATFYSEFRDLQYAYVNSPYPFLYVYDPYTLLQIKPEPLYVVNMFNLTGVPNPGERLWSNGAWTFNEAEKHITDIMTRLATRHTVIFHSLDSLLSNLEAWNGAVK